jgi:hypothetical protein
MAAVGVTAVAVVLLAGHLRAAAGFAVGAGLAIVNYYWLHQAIATLFSGGSVRVPRRVLLKFAARYPLAFMGIYLCYKTGWLPMAAIIPGLFVPVGGVLIEALVQIHGGLRSGIESSRVRSRHAAGATVPRDELLGAGSTERLTH